MEHFRERSPFTFQYYEHMLRCAIDQGYSVSSFEKFDGANRKTVILRHDVDYTLNGVPQLAEVENKLGISATYCFRVHAHEYNLFTPHVHQLVQCLRTFGHEIGLHIEATTVARALDKDPGQLIEIEKRALELAAECPVITASEHRDISHVVHNTPYFHEIHNIHDFGFKNYSMEDRFFKDMKYLSDSNGVWREGDLIEHLGKHDRFQVLIHPDWWFEKDLLLKGPYFHGLGN